MKLTMTFNKYDWLKITDALFCATLNNVLKEDPRYTELMNIINEALTSQWDDIN